MNSIIKQYSNNRHFCQEINSLKNELTSLQDLKVQVAQLTQMVMKQNVTTDGKSQVGDE